MAWHVRCSEWNSSRATLCTKGVPHQWLTNQLGGWGFLATSSTQLHWKGCVKGFTKASLIE